MACNNASDSVTEIIRLEQFDYYNQKQNEVIYVNMENMDFLPPTTVYLGRPATALSFRSQKSTKTRCS